MSKKYKPINKHDPIDTDVQLPAAIRAASARSDQLHQEAYVAAPDKVAEKDVANSEEANGVEQGEQKPQVAQPQEAQQKAQGQAAQERAQEVEEDKPQAQPNEWEHKYNSLKGRYDQQGNTISTLTGRISDMERMIANMSEESKLHPTPASQMDFKPIGQEERETFGDDFIDVAQRAAMERLNPEVSRLSGEIRKLQDQLGRVTSTTAANQKQNIYTFLDSKMENWRDVNRDKDFIAWASLPDPYSGATRIEMMRGAFDKGDGPRVLNFFQGFLNDEAAMDPARAHKPEFPATKQNKIPLEAFAAPGRAKAPAAMDHAAPGEKETISHAQIANFYRLKTAGHWKGNPEEEAALEARIFEAQREGRIV